MANVMDASWYHEEFAKSFRISSIYELPSYARDADHLSLMDHLGSNFISRRSPCIYFVDRFVSLRDNLHWLRHRRSINDVVADRNGNIVLASSLISDNGEVASPLDKARVKKAIPAFEAQLEEAKSLAGAYKNTAEGNDRIWLEFTRLTDTIPELRVHRDYVEANSWGFGDRAFHMMWLFLLSSVRRTYGSIRALEVGVYKGQILSLWHLIGRLLNVSVSSVGISPLRGTASQTPTKATLRAMRHARSYYPDSDYRGDVHQIFADFSLGTDALTLIEGHSQDAGVRKRVSKQCFDVVYVDGDHRASIARRDLRVYQRLVAANGYLVVDDAGTDLPGTKFWKGLPEVTDALAVVDAKEFDNIFNIGHNRIYQRRRFASSHGQGRLRRPRK
jgi:hypothetical protein